MPENCQDKSKTFSPHQGEDVVETILEIELSESYQSNCNAEPRETQEKQMKQKTEIEIELSETIAYSRRAEKFEAYCPQCQALVEMAVPQVAAILTQSNEREIYRLVETGKIHFIETDRVLVCLNSIIKFAKNLKDSILLTGGELEK